MKLQKLKLSVSLTLCWSLIAVTCAVLQAQDTSDQKEPITIGTAVTIDSEIMDEERSIQVYLPDSYENSQSTHYPVLYLLDGETFFHHVTGIVDFLSGVYRTPPMIVVGITNTDRMRDMTIPSDRAERIISNGKDTLRIPVPPTAGGADNFLQFLTKELVPKIENKYRTAPFRLLVGHSLAGLFAVHAFMASPKTFNTFMTISPSLAWDNRSLIHKAQIKLDSLKLDGRFLYMTAGENELPATIDNLQTFAAKVEDANPQGLHWWHQILPDESHPSVMHRSVYDGLETIFNPYRINEQDLMSGNISTIEVHFAEASEFYGYNIDVPEQIINTMGYMQIQFAQQPKKAIKIFQYNTELYPKSANVYDSLGDGYSAAGNLKEAKTSYQKAVKLAEQQDHPNIDTYQTNLQRVTEQLEGEKETAN